MPIPACGWTQDAVAWARGLLLREADLATQMMSVWSRVTLHTQAAVARTVRGLAPIAGPCGPATRHQTVAELELARLLHYPSLAPAAAERRAPILFVPSLINRYYVLDLLDDLSVIRLLCERGHELFVLDWKATGARGPELGLADYTDDAIGEAVHRVTELAGCEQVGLLGYCMGGTLATIHAARHPERIRALCLLGTPIDFHASGKLAELVSPDRFNADALMDLFGNMPALLMQQGFKLLNPSDAWLKMMHMHYDCRDADWLRHWLAVEGWLEDNSSFPGGVYREYIRELYQKNALVTGQLELRGQPVELHRLVAPLLNVIALNDGICTPPSSRALMDRVGSVDREVLEFATGHIGLATSRRAHRELWPRVADWLDQRLALPPAGENAAPKPQPKKGSQQHDQAS